MGIRNHPWRDITIRYTNRSINEKLQMFIYLKTLNRNAERLLLNMRKNEKCTKKEAMKD